MGYFAQKELSIIKDLISNRLQEIESSDESYIPPIVSAKYRDILVKIDRLQNDDGVYKSVLSPKEFGVSGLSLQDLYDKIDGESERLSF